MLSGLRTTLFALSLACALLVPAAGAMAQQSGQAQETAQDSAQVPAQQELQKLADTLKDEQKRQALIEQIEALVKVQDASGEAQEPVPMSSLLGRVSARIGVLSGALVQGIEAVFNYDRVLDWGMTLARDEQRRERLLSDLR